MYVSDTVRADFSERLDKTLKLIEQYNIQYIELGIFGSYARDTYKASSDIDMCIITNDRPSRRISGSLREEVELLNVDIIFVTYSDFKNSKTCFMDNVRKDYRRIA